MYYKKIKYHMSTGQVFRIHRLDSGGLHVGEACTKHWYPIGDVPKTDTLITSVYGFLVQNQSVLELWVCNPATNWRVFSWSRHYNFWHIRGITHRYPNRYPKASESHDKSVWKAQWPQKLWIASWKPISATFILSASNGSGVCMSCFAFNAFYPRSMSHCLTFSFSAI